MKHAWRLLFYIRSYWLPVIASVVLMAIVGLMDAFRLLLIGPILDNVLKPQTVTDQINLIPANRFNIQFILGHYVPHNMHNAWTVVAFALVVSTLLKGVCDYAGTYLVNYAGFGIITHLRNDLYESIMGRSVAFFQRHTTGTIISTLINDVDRVQNAMSNVLSEFLQQTFTLIFTAIVVVALGGKLAWILLLFVPIVITSARRVGRGVRHTTRKGQDRLAEIQNILHETISGNRIVKAFNTELWEILRFKTAARRLFRANLRSVRAQAISSPLMDTLGSVAIAFLLLLGRSQVQRGAFTPGAYVAFLFAVFKLYDPVRKFALFYNSFQQALGASGKIFSFMDEKDQVVQRAHPTVLKHFEKNIEMDNVSFHYGEGECPEIVLRNINLNIQRGEIVALVGPSGAGKTTLANLIPRFFDVTEGVIRVDGHDIRDLSLASLRGQIAKVSQETILFNDTVANNIAYGKPETPFAKIEAAARAALAHDFILKMPDGYNTIIGEKGFRLSGGERQRLSIARALLKNAPILILDEATSSLDAESEAHVQQALGNLMENRTVIVIAHRLATVRRANRIAVLESGSITAIGTHDELLTTSPTYQRLYNLQFADAPTLSVMESQ
jgi:subfamily B ATP-binding cassette protein MsbA